MHNYAYIKTNEALESLCNNLKEKDVIALDTEFIRVSTFYPKAGLFQLYDGKQYALIDPLAIDAWQPFTDILQDDRIVKILHACDEDIELFYHHMGAITVNVFDTQVAAAFSGFDYCMGYQRLVEKLCDVTLEKSVSRSDWLKRPLSPIQIEYAMADVEHLIPMYRSLSEKTQANGMHQAIKEEYQTVTENIRDEAFNAAYQRIKSAWKLNGMQLSRLKALAVWREQCMRQYDKPRKHVATNDALLRMAEKPNWHRSELFHIDGLPEKTAKNHSDQLLELLANDYEKLEPLKRPVKADKLHRRIKSLLSGLAREASIAESMLCKRVMVDALYSAIISRSWQLPPMIAGWRSSYYEQVLVTLKNEHATDE